MNKLSFLQSNKQLLIAKPDLLDVAFNVRVGDLVSISVIKLEGERESVSTFVGLCIGFKHKGLFSSLTLQNNLGGVVVVQNFQLCSPLILAVSIVKVNSLLYSFRRSKMYLFKDDKKSSSIRFKFVFSLKAFNVKTNYYKQFLSEFLTRDQGRSFYSLF